MILEEYIRFIDKAIEKKGEDFVVKVGFGNPHSWRGSYVELAFEPVDNITLGKMRNEAVKAINATYTGYKGGEFKMGMFTDVNIDYEGHYSNGGELFQLLFHLMFE